MFEGKTGAKRWERETEKKGDGERKRTSISCFVFFFTFYNSEGGGGSIRLNGFVLRRKRLTAGRLPVRWDWRVALVAESLLAKRRSSSAAAGREVEIIIIKSQIEIKSKTF